jgi:hypothetical protein
MIAIFLITILAIAVIVAISAQGQVNFVMLEGVITATNLDGEYARGFIRAWWIIGVQTWPEMETGVGAVNAVITAQMTLHIALMALVQNVRWDTLLSRMKTRHLVMIANR